MMVSQAALFLGERRILTPLGYNRATEQAL
jgi:hypothetical protein